MNNTIISFDADDTLWVNEPYFFEMENHFLEIMSAYHSQEKLSSILYHKQIENIPIYGYGAKSYVLTMIEVASSINGVTIPPEAYNKIINIGKELLNHEIILLNGVKETLEYLNKKYKLIVATKGDLKDQHRKLHESGLGHYFHHIEVMIEKTPLDYKKMLNRLNCLPEKFIMIGNSIKSDVLPVLEIGARAIYIPFHTTWQHECVDYEVSHPNMTTLKNMQEVMSIL